MDGQRSGNGSTSPFGNGNGATSSGGASSGAHDFLKDPESHSPKTGGRDFTKESRAQPSGGPDGCNPASIPPGGKLPFGNDPAEREGVQPVHSSRKPFRLGGGPSGGSAEGPPPEAGSIPDEGY